MVKLVCGGFQQSQEQCSDTILFVCSKTALGAGGAKCKMVRVISEGLSQLLTVNIW